MTLPKQTAEVEETEGTETISSGKRLSEIYHFRWYRIGRDFVSAIRALDWSESVAKIKFAVDVIDKNCRLHSQLICRTTIGMLIVVFEAVREKPRCAVCPSGRRK